MTPTYDQATLFLEPPARRDAERAQPAPDHRAETMRALCHPFAVRTEPAAASVR